MAGACCGAGCAGSAAGAAAGGSGSGWKNEGTPGPNTGGPGKGCTKEMGMGGAVSWDPVPENLCFEVVGRAVIIGDTEFSVEGGFRMANYNMHISGAQVAVASQYSMPKGSAVT